mmetsp:Transcript_7171/g.16649  ORF Transcript_7171/g.16649 Transcript_7171/m.16649 type:complete len:223 (-) Transcript_7171:465-1133(-)
MARVKNRDGRRKKTLAAPEGVLEDRQVLVYLVLSHEVHGEFVNCHAEVIQCTVRSVRRIYDLVCLLGRKSSLHLSNVVLLVLTRGREVSLHRSYECPGHEAHLLEVLRPHGGVDRDITVSVPSGGHSIKIASVVDIQTPEFTRLVPSTVGLVRAERKKKPKRRRKKGERSQREGQSRKVRDDSIMLDPTQVDVTTGESVPDHQEGGKGRSSSDLASEGLVDS